MSKRLSNKFYTTNKQSEQYQLKYRKCAYHLYSYHYATNMHKHDTTLPHLVNKLESINMNSTVNIK